MKNNTIKIPNNLNTDINNIVTKEKLEKYFDVTGRALKKVKLVLDGIIDGPQKKISFDFAAKDYLDMAQRYYDDATYFYKTKNDYVLAFAALNYAHGWLDAGARIGLFDVDHDNVLFTVD
jgi:hypothetical protein